MNAKKVRLTFDVWRDKEGRIYLSCDDERLERKGFVLAISERMVKVHQQLSDLLAKEQA